MAPYSEEGNNGSEERMDQATQRFSAAVEEFARQVGRLRGEGDTGEGPAEEAKREPRGPLFYGDDPTLAKRAEEALHVSGE